MNPDLPPAASEAKPGVAPSPFPGPALQDLEELKTETARLTEEVQETLRRLDALDEEGFRTPQREREKTMWPNWLTTVAELAGRRRGERFICPTVVAAAAGAIGLWMAWKSHQRPARTKKGSPRKNSPPNATEGEIPEG